MRRSEGLNKLITIQYLEDSEADDYGEVANLDANWKTYARQWASIEALGGSEGSEADRLKATVNYEFRMRYIAGVTSKMRILWNDPRVNRDRVFEIVLVTDSEQSTFETVIQARETV